MAATPVLDQAVRYDEPEGDPHRRQRRALYVVATTVLSLIVLSALLDSIIGIAIYGVDHRTVRASAHGVELAVSYPRVIRGQLDSPLEISIQRDGGFTGDVTVSISAGYLGLFTNQRPNPEPGSQTAGVDDVVSTFDAPQGDRLDVQWDMAPRPRAWFHGVTAVAAVLDEQGHPIVSVTFRTDVRP